MRRIVIGVGNPVRGDDGAGLEVAGRLRRVETYQRSTGSYDLIDLWDGADEVIVVDAARSGAPAGTIHRFDAHDQPLPEGVLATSTHSVGVMETIEMARSLGRLPKRVVVYGIEVSTLAPGSGLSEVVEQAVNELVTVIDNA
ncbi:MAG TPA: hydrogenase maturation protease [Acidimicrobiia bacterium]|nr:hydrogenase maturation protease [Acidimicrobiia bacterium]